MKINFSTMTDEERTTAFAALDNEALAANLAEARTEATALFALSNATVAQADEAEALVASIQHIETEQASRAAAVKDAEDRFAAARSAFSAEGDAAEGDGTDEGDGDEGDVVEGDGTDEGDGDEGDGTDEGDGDEGDAAEGGEGEGAVTAAANHTASQSISTRARKTTAASRVGAKTKRPTRTDASPVTITAAADVPGFGTGTAMKGMVDVAKAVQSRARGFAKFNARAAERAFSESGGQPVLNKFGVASFSVQTEHGKGLTPKSGVAAEYDAVGEAVKAHVERINASLGFQGEAAQTAAMAWCSPSEVVYNWIADFVVDGLVNLPEVAAPRGGLMMTEGPQLLQTVYDDGAAIDGFGFGGTEADMEAGYVKECETIVCPEFLDHRLDFDGYCWKIPILTEKTFPELIADAMRVSEVAYAHKMNRRFIGDILDESTPVTANDVYGGSMLDTLEAVVQIAVKERRWWNLGENAVLEVKLPQVAREIFKFDMQRRSGLALSDIATDQRIAALFANHKLAVTYLSDFDQVYGSATPTPNWPDEIRAIIYPAGTFVKAQDDVINLSAVYDAASLSHNEYTGVFYEQGVKTIRRGYRSTVVTVPVCTAGAMGGFLPTCSDIGSF